jgi:protein-S-isoprenylcysteine O-methyltransferase Ste14
MLLSQTMTTTGEVLFRRRSWMLLLFLPLLAVSFPREEIIEKIAGDTIEDAYEVGCLVLVFGGLVLRALTVGFVPARTSGRNVRGQVAGVLNTTGLYSLCRNPLYLANCITYLGVVLLTQNLLLAVTFALVLALYYERIILAEEAFLLAQFGDEYSDWTTRVPAFWPRLGGWRRPELPFSMRSVLRRENPSWFGAIIAAMVVTVAGDMLSGEEQGFLEAGQLAQLSVATAVFFTLRLLKSRTRLLNAPGR